MNKNLSWISLLYTGAETIKAIYKDDIPSLNNVEIKQIILGANHLDQIAIDIYLQDFPVIPPKKWQDREYNTVALTLNLLTIKKVKVNNWENQYNKKVCIFIKNIDDYIQCKVIGDNFKMECICGFIGVTNFYAYCNE